MKTRHLAALLAALLLTLGAAGHTEGAPLTLTGDLAKDSAAIMAHNKKVVAVDSATGGTDRFLVITYLARSGLDTLLGATDDLHDLVRDVCQAKGGTPLPSLLIKLLEPAVDQYGNKVHGELFFLAWHSATLERINWANLEGWQLLELAIPAKMTPMGRTTAATYCRDAIPGGYGRQLCARFAALEQKQ